MPAAASEPRAATAARAGWAGPCAARSLREGRAGRVVIGLPRGAYVDLDGHWLLLAPPRAPLGPLTLLVSGLPAAPPAVGTPAAREGDALVVGDLRIDLRAIRTPAPLPPLPLSARAPAAAAAALARRPAPPGELTAGIARLRAGDVPAAVAALAGRGEGLTPAGDDVLAGYGAWRAADGAPPALAALAAGRAAPLGLAYLRCAERGELAEPALRLLRAIRCGDAPSAERAAGALDRWGATSGSALLWGIAAGARGVPWAGP